jgi:hypothetical protein
MELVAEHCCQRVWNVTSSARVVISRKSDEVAEVWNGIRGKNCVI